MTEPSFCPIRYGKKASDCLIYTSAGCSCENCKLTYVDTGGKL